MILAINYQLMSIILTILSLCGVGTVCSMFWKDRHDKHVANSEERKRQYEEQRRKDIKEVVDECLKPIKAEQANIKTQIANICEGEQSSLRNSLTQLYITCRDEKRYRGQKDTENFEHMYDAYHKLNGNSYVDQMKEDFENLPTRDELDEQKGYFEVKRKKK